MGKKRNRSKRRVVQELEPFRLTSKKMKRFVYFYVEGDCTKGVDCLRKAGYADGYCNTGNLNNLLQDARVSLMIKKAKCLAEEEELRKRVMTPLQRKVALSDIARADLSDYVTMDGHGGLDIEFDGKSKNRQAVSSIKITETPDRNGDIITGKEIKLRDPMKAIDVLNKMDGLYQTNVNVRGDVNIQFGEDDEGL